MAARYRENFDKSWQQNDGSCGFRHTLGTKYHSHVLCTVYCSSCLAYYAKHRNGKHFALNIYVHSPHTHTQSVVCAWSRRGRDGETIATRLCVVFGELHTNQLKRERDRTTTLCMRDRVDFFNFNFEPPPSPHLPVNGLRQKWRLNTAPCYVICGKSFTFATTR